MHTFSKLIAAAALLAAAAGSASAHGSFHGGGGGHGGGFGGGFSHGFGGGYNHQGWGRHYGRYGFGDYDYSAMPSYDEGDCGDGYHFGRDGRCWPDER